MLHAVKKIDFDQNDYFFNLQSYHCRTLLLTSQKFTAEWEGTDEHAEWVVDMYPKGVWFQRCLTVYRPPGMEVRNKPMATDYKI